MKDKRPNPSKSKKNPTTYSHLPWPYVTKTSKIPDAPTPVSQ